MSIFFLDLFYFIASKRKFCLYKVLDMTMMWRMAWGDMKNCHIKKKNLRHPTCTIVKKCKLWIYFIFQSKKANDTLSNSSFLCKYNIFSIRRWQLWPHKSVNKKYFCSPSLLLVLHYTRNIFEQIYLNDSCRHFYIFMSNLCVCSV